MMRICLLIGSFIFLGLQIQGQKNLNSPFSRLGLGLTADSYNGQSFAMGGVTTALNDPTRINSFNPASYAFLKNTSSEFSFGGVYSSVNDGNSSVTNFNAHLSGFTLGFPMGKHFGGAFGIAPRYKNGYTISRELDPTTNDSLYNEGFGGLNNAFIGAAFKVKGLSIGANLTYNFGNLIQQRSLFYSDDIYNDVRVETETYLSDFDYRLGLQYETPVFFKGWNAVIGASLRQTSDIASSFSEVAYNFVEAGGVVFAQDTLSNVSQEGSVTLPQDLRLGISFKKGEHWLIAGEYESREFSNFRMFDQNMGLNDATQYRFGIQYSPLERMERREPTQSLMNKLVYRIGARYQETYMMVNNAGVNEFGINVGVDLPVFFKYDPVISYVNIGLEFGKMGDINQNQLSENFVKFNLSYTFNDRWFIKEKID